jgi:hypothetical protein
MIIVWQAGKSLAQMYLDQTMMIEALRLELQRLATEKDSFNAAYLYTAMKKAGYTLEHQDINKLLRKMNIYPSGKGTNLYESRSVLGRI